MKKLTLLTFFIVLLFSFNSKVFGQTVTLNVDYAADEIIIPVIVDGKGPFQFVLDTGSDTFVSDRVLQSLSLEKQKDAIATTTLNTISGKGKFLIFPAYALKIKGTNFEQALPLKAKFTSSDENSIAKALDKTDGILGADFFASSILQYDADQRQLYIKRISNNTWCSVGDTPEKCFKKDWYQPTVKARMGRMQSEIILDTGLTGTEKIIMYKSDFTNKLWRKYHNSDFDVKIPLVSDYDLLSLIGDGLFFHKKKRCIAQFFIRNPADRTKLRGKTTGIIGWNALKNMDFEINFVKRITKISRSSCPAAGYNRAGIIGYIISEDFKTLNVQILDESSPAVLAGIQKGDIIEKITVADTGQEFDTFNTGFHQGTFFLPTGTRLILNIRRKGVLMKKCVTLNDYQAVDLTKLDKTK